MFVCMYVCMYVYTSPKIHNPSGLSSDQNGAIKGGSTTRQVPRGLESTIKGLKNHNNNKNSTNNNNNNNNNDDNNNNNNNNDDNNYNNYNNNNNDNNDSNNMIIIMKNDNNNVCERLCFQCKSPSADGILKPTLQQSLSHRVVPHSPHPSPSWPEHPGPLRNALVPFRPSRGKNILISDKHYPLG